MQDKFLTDKRDIAACKPAPGNFRPVINRNKCEGKADCVIACPYNVFIIELLPYSERSALSFKGKIKGLFHGWNQAFTPNADACHACGRCVSACAEQAITLRRVESPPLTASI